MYLSSLVLLPSPDTTEVITIITQKRKGRSSIYKTIFHLHVCMTYFCFIKYKNLSNWKLLFQLSLEILIPCFIEKARHPYLALLRLMVTGSSTFSISPGSAMYSLSSAHFDAASSIARSTLHAFASIKSLHKKSAVSSAEFGL